MKILKIENNAGFFLNPVKENATFKNIEEIDRSDIMDMIEYLIDNTIEMDIGNDANLPNPSQRIIYTNLYTKLNEISLKKDEIKKEIDDHFAEAEKKYIKENS